MKKKIFDKNLMFEGFSQLKLPGLIFLVVSVLGSGLYAISKYFSQLNYLNQLAVYGRNVTIQNVQIVDIQDVAPLLLPLVYLAPFIFCLMLFSFLNNRKGSDYYHALSCTRVCLFLSFTASILIWLALIIVPTVLVASFIYGITGAIFNVFYIPYLIFTFFAAAVLVTACMLVAMSITGTVFTNTILFGLILFLPRFAIYFLMSNITESVRILPSNAGGLLDIGYNIPVNLIFRTFRSFNYSMSALYTSIPAILYTFILAILYIALACFLFHRRKSETAGNSAPNRIMQHVFRCVITLPVALFIPILLLSYNSADYKSYGKFLQGHTGTIIALVVISLLIYFLYELLTTKSVKRMFRSAPLLLAVAVFCVLFGVTLNAVKSSLLNFSPSAAEIESVTIQPTNIYMNSSNVTYNSLALETLPLTSSTIKSAVADTLADNVRMIKTSPQHLSQVRYDNYIVNIKLKNGLYAQRILYATSLFNARLKKAIYTNIPFFNTITALPDEKSVDNVTTPKDSYAFSDKASIQKLWKCFRAEYATLSYSEKLSADLNPDYYNTDYPVLDIYGSNGISRFKCSYLLSNKLPKTQMLYAELINAQNKAKARTLLSAYIKNAKGRSFPSVILYNCSKAGLPPSTSGTFSLSSIIKENETDQEVNICGILQQTFNDPIDMTKPYVCVSVDSGYYTFDYYQAITVDNVKKIKTLLSTPKK